MPSTNDLSWNGDWLCFGRRKVIRVVPDGVYPTMWRVELPDGGLTDMVNRTRAKDAAVGFAHRILNPDARRGTGGRVSG